MKNTPHSPELAPFDLAAFVAQFPLFARAPNGIANLRALILQLAVQGKLVPQDFEEIVKVVKNPDEKLLFGRGRELPKIKASEQVFSIPSNWQWMRLGSIGHNHGQKQPTDEFTYIDVSAIDNHTGSIVNAELVSAELAPSRARKIVKKGTLVYSTVRPYLLNIAIIEQDFIPEPIASTAFAIIHPFEGIDIRFIYFFLRSPQFVAYVEKVQQGVAYPAINDEKFFMGICPVPPLEEQQRIVAKVDELMALCDQLEAQQDDQARNLLEANTAVIQAVMQPPDDAIDTFNQQWQRIANYLNMLYGYNLPLPTDMRRGKLKNKTVALENVAKLRLLIMGLGVSGRLLESSEIIKDDLKQTFENYQKKVLSAVGITEQRRLQKQFSTKTDLSDFKLILPKHWLAIELGNVAIDFSYGTSSKSEVNGEIPVLRMGNIQNGRICWDDLVFSNNSNDNRKYKLTKGDVLFNRTNSPELVGKTAVFDGVRDAIYAGYLIKVSCAKEMLNPDFLSLCINSAYGKDWCQSVKSDGVSQSNINAQKLADFIIPLPPLEEQHRIVAQVDELMALCDTLETLLTEQRQVAADFSAAAVLAVTA